MSDTDWEAMRSKWASAAGPLPDIRAVAQQQAARHRRANWIFFSLMAFGGAAQLWGAISGRDPIFAWSLIAWALLLCLGFVWLQRGAGVREGGAPREALAYLERRVRIERGGAQLVRWTYPPLMLFTAIYYRNLFGGDEAWVAKLVARGIVLAMAALTFSAPWLVRRFTEAQQAEIGLWRKWMDEQQL